MCGEGGWCYFYSCAPFPRLCSDAGEEDLLSRFLSVAFEHLTLTDVPQFMAYVVEVGERVKPKPHTPIYAHIHEVTYTHASSLRRERLLVFVRAFIH